MDIQYYDDIIIGGGKAGKTLAPALVAGGRKTFRGRQWGYKACWIRVRAFNPR